MGRFDYRVELDNIYRGMQRDMQLEVGQTIPWFVFDAANTQIDPIYDVGGTPSGRRWKDPIFLPVVNAIKLEGEEVTNDRGFYVIDTFRIIFSADAAVQSGLGDIIYNPDQHNIDRLVYENKVFAVSQIRVRGILTAGYAVCGVDAKQVKDEEMVNDPQFQAFISDPTLQSWANEEPFYPATSITHAPKPSVVVS